MNEQGRHWSGKSDNFGKADAPNICPPLAVVIGYQAKVNLGALDLGGISKRKPHW